MAPIGYFYADNETLVGPIAGGVGALLLIVVVLLLVLLVLRRYV